MQASLTVDATHWTRLSCYRFRANEASCASSPTTAGISCAAALPRVIQSWSLTSLQPAALQDQRTPDPARPVLHPAVRRELLAAELLVFLPQMAATTYTSKQSYDCVDILDSDGHDLQALHGQGPHGNL
jgi:hypothetical protein